MNKEKLERAMIETKRFYKAAQKLSKENKDTYFTGTASSGAVKRASMDLTRALADLRKPL